MIDRPQPPKTDFPKDEYMPVSEVGVLLEYHFTILMDAVDEGITKAVKGIDERAAKVKKEMDERTAKVEKEIYGNGGDGMKVNVYHHSKLFAEAERITDKTARNLDKMNEQIADNKLTSMTNKGSVKWLKWILGSFITLLGGGTVITLVIILI